MTASTSGRSSRRRGSSTASGSVPGPSRRCPGRAADVSVPGRRLRRPARPAGRAGAQERRASIADADQAQPHGCCFGSSRVGFGQRPLREGKAGRGRTAKKPTTIEGDGWHRRETPRQCSDHQHATQAGKIRLIPLLYPGQPPRSTATPAPNSVEPGDGPAQSGCVGCRGPVKNIISSTDYATVARP